MFITDRSLHGIPQPTAMVLDALEAAITSAHPVRLVPQAVKAEGDALVVRGQRFPIPARGVTVIGGGKASGAMTSAFEDVLGTRPIRAGVVATAATTWSPVRVRQIIAGHPTPTPASREAVQEIRKILRDLSPDDLVVCLLSGGGSAMLTQGPPPFGRTRDMVRLTSLLLASGADIAEINIVRRHLSRSAGGKLARAAAPARILTLALRDVVSGPPEAIASGPTLQDPTTFADAIAVLDRYELRERIPRTLRNFLEQGLAGNRLENPKPGDPLFDRCTFVEIGDIRDALHGAVAWLGQTSVGDVQVLGNDLRGEARVAATQIGAQIRAAAQAVSIGGRALVWGGEFTVTVGGARGEGGRCQEFMAALIPEIAGLECTVAMVGTDGVDFVSGIGGAVINGETARRTSTLGLDLMAALRDHATTSFHRTLGSLIQMRPTGTNVCDIGIAMLLPDLAP